MRFPLGAKVVHDNQNLIPEALSPDKFGGQYRYANEEQGYATWSWHPPCGYRGKDEERADHQYKGFADINWDPVPPMFGPFSHINQYTALDKIIEKDYN